MSAVIDEKTEPKLATSTADLVAAIDRLAEKKGTTTFTLRTPVLKQGRSDMILSATENHWVQLKCYASGGENALHSHTHEDHTFVILQGEAIFHGPKGEVARLRRNQGITIPKGHLYKFHASGEENLILLRFGAMDKDCKDKLARLDEHGNDLDGFSPHNAPADVPMDPVVVPGRWFE